MSINNFINFYVAKVLPFLSLALFIFQFFCNYIFYLDIEQTKNNIFFTITKFLYIFFYSMTVISFLRTYSTEPGYVTEDTNEKFLYLYQKTRKYSLKRADMYNELHNLIKENENDNNDLYTDGTSSDDEKIFTENQYLTNLYHNCKRSRICLNFDVKQCRQCHIVKVCGTVHCSVCHKCVYMLDHHCIWFNKCIGQFNLKYFFLFALYLFFGSFISISKISYYILYKNYSKILPTLSQNYIIMLITCSFLDIVYTCFSFKLVQDHYTNLYDFAILYDRKRGKMIEIRSIYETLCEDFGDEFGINGFLPYKAGGFYGLIKNKTVIKSHNDEDEINRNKVKKN
jgi:palmitoyltransferase